MSKQRVNNLGITQKLTCIQNTCLGPSFRGQESTLSDAPPVKNVLISGLTAGELADGGDLWTSQS